MKYLTIISIFIVLLGYHPRLSSQSCLPLGITFSTQEQIDNFEINYPGCTEIEGTVFIEGNDITNFNGLSVLTSIGTNLQIKDNNALTSLNGLHNLASVGGYFEISRND